MRIRSTKPEFWRSKTIASVDWETRLVLKGVESYVDDNGVGKDSVILIAADVFPHDLAHDPDTLARISRALTNLSEANLLVRYEVHGESLLYVRRWKNVQRVDKPNRGRYPRPDGTLEYDEDVDESIGAGQAVAVPIKAPAVPDTVASPREGVANVPEGSAPGTEEQRNRGTDTSGDGDVAEIVTTFEAFYAAYPRREARRKAEQAWRAALKRADADTIMAGLERFRFSEERRFIPLPASWLNGDRWADQAAVPVGSGSATGGGLRPWEL
jgi:hypothetical protein